MCPAALLPGEPRDYPQNTDVISSAGSQPAAFLPGFVAVHTQGGVRGSVGVSGPHGWVPVHAYLRPSTLLNSEMRVWGLRTPQQARGLPERLAGLSGYSDGRLNPAWGPAGPAWATSSGLQTPGHSRELGAVSSNVDCRMLFVRRQ